MGALSAPDPVVVVGAGPTGLTAAVELAQRGVAVTVLERWDAVFPQPRAIAMDDEVQRILAGVGIGEAMAATTRPAHGLQLLDRRHRTLARFDRSGRSEATGFWRACMFDQPTLERLLRERATEFPGLLTLRIGVEVTGVQQDGPGPVQVLATRRDTGAHERLRASYVLACDGARSTIRHAIGATMADLRFEQRWLVVDVDTEAALGQWPGVHQVCDSRRAATFMPGHTATRYRWEFQMHDDEDVERDFTMDRLLPLLAPWTGDVDPADLDVVRSTAYTFRARLADRWREGRVFLLGDAAHQTPPFIGQGLCAGVRDAANLAWKIAGVVDGTLAADVLDSYEAERRPHAHTMIDMARLTGRVMTGGGPAGDLLRRAVVPGLPRMPGLRRRLLDSATPALAANPWVQRSRGQRLPGSLVPNVPTPSTPGGRLDDELAGRWALVTATPPAPSDRAVLRDRGVVVVEGVADLDHWLRGDRAAAALVRPDGVVLAVADGPSTLCGIVDRLLAPVATVATVATS